MKQKPAKHSRHTSAQARAEGQKQAESGEHQGRGSTIEAAVRAFFLCGKGLGQGSHPPRAVAVVVVR